MSASNRATLIGKLNTALKKHYKPAPAQPTRPLLEHVLYGSLLEDTPIDLADEGMAKCEQEFYDWNEVRVTTVTELSQVLSRLPDPLKAAQRMKSNLQGIFEEFYTFDLDHLKKDNLGKAVNKFERMPGMTPFVLSYTIQHGLGGHSIPVDYSAMVIMLATGIATQPEAMAGKVPGLERAIPKNKGIDFANLLHQAAAALRKSTNDKTARAMIDAASKGSSKRLDEWLANKKAAKKRVEKRKADEKLAAKAAKRAEAREAEKAAKAALEAKQSPPRGKKIKEPIKKELPVKPGKKVATKAADKKTTAKAAAKKPAVKKTDSKKTKAATKKAPVKKAPVKKVAVKKAATKKTTSKKATKAPVKKKVAAKAVKKTAKPTVKKKTTKKVATKAKAAKKVSPKAKATNKSAAKKSTNRKLTKRKPR